MRFAHGGPDWTGIQIDPSNYRSCLIVLLWDPVQDSHYWVSLLDAYLADLLSLVLDFEHKLAVQVGLHSLFPSQVHEFMVFDGMRTKEGGNKVQWTKNESTTLTQVENEFLQRMIDKQAQGKKYPKNPRNLRSLTQR